MILNRRHNQEEELIRKLIILIRVSGDESIQKQEDLAKYIRTVYRDLSFEESRDILLAWKKVKENPERFIRTELSDEIVRLFQE